MKTAVLALGMLALLALICWLRVFPFREKKATQPQRSSMAEVISRQVETGANRTGRSSGLGYNYRITFRLEDCSEISLYAYDYEYGSVREGMKGRLVWKGRYFVSFDQEV